MELYFWPGQKNHPRDTTVGALTNHLLRHYAILASVRQWSGHLCYWKTAVWREYIAARASRLLTVTS